ncbi:MAG: hypothetical protein GU357_02035 [Thermofilum sp.]|nr:hypothetical protein [Thermofilum sp.]
MLPIDSQWRAIAGLLALYTGANATFGHIPGWGKWSPWYGAVKVGG